MLTLADYTSPELLVPELQSRSTPAVMAELCHTLERSGRVPDPLSFYNAVVSHEHLTNTAMAPGWALPHARLTSLSSLCFALGRSATPLNWLEAGGPPVRLVFLFSVPEVESASYMQLLATLARLSQDPVRWQALLQAPDRPSLFKLLQQLPVCPPQTAAGGKRRAHMASL